MAISFPGVNFEVGLDGYGLWAQDIVSPTVYDPQYTSIMNTIMDNLAVVYTADNTQAPHNTVLGCRYSMIMQRGPVGLDRGFPALFANVTGPRNTSGVNTGNLTPFIGTFKRGAVTSPYSLSSIWINRLSVDSGFSTDGLGNLVNYNIEAICVDPDNRRGASNLTAPGTLGTTGLDLSSYLQTSYYNSIGTGGTQYDGVRRFVFNWSNSTFILPVPDKTYAQYRMAAGCMVGPPIGTLQVFQLENASNPIPMNNTTSTSGYPFVINIPSPDGTHTWTIGLAIKYAATGQPIDLRGAIVNSVTYDIIGFQSGSGTSSWPVNSVYS